MNQNLLATTDAMKKNAASANNVYSTVSVSSGVNSAPKKLVSTALGYGVDGDIDEVVCDNLVVVLVVSEPVTEMKMVVN